MASGGSKSNSRANSRPTSKTVSQVQSRAASQVKSRAKRKVKNKIRKSPIIIEILVLLAVAAFLMYNYGEEWFGISFITVYPIRIVFARQLQPLSKVILL